MESEKHYLSNEWGEWGQGLHKDYCFFYVKIRLSSIFSLLELFQISVVQHFYFCKKTKTKQ